jgi:hypothetical protein
MSILKDGNVGIGTTAPASTLHIRTSANNNYEFEEVSGELRLSALNDARSANVPLQFAASEFNFVTGSVGIGTTAPADKLHLQAPGKFRNGHGVDHSANFSIPNNTTKNFTIASMAYGTAELHFGFYGGGSGANVHVTLGGHMSSSSKIY